eukprot:14977067-Ditylum_brightwellii.AAC.1
MCITAEVSQLSNTTHTSEYVPMHRWNTSPLAPTTNSIGNLTDGIDFNAPFFPDSTGNNSNKDVFLHFNNFMP